MDTMNSDPAQRPAAESAEQPVWRLIWLDDNGNHFEIARDLSRQEAQARLKHLEDAGHKQFYWILPKQDDQTAT